MKEYRMSVAEICGLFGWTPTDLSRQAQINARTAKSAYDGKEPSARTKRDICSAFSREFDRKITPAEVAWDVD